MTALKSGIFVKPTADVGRNLEAVQQLDDAGVQTVWQTNNVLWPDPMTFFGAAATTTKQIAFGTSIMQAYPRHPSALVSQAQVIETLAPGRLRLGVGTSHRVRMERNLGLKMDKPLSFLKEYVGVLRALLWEGKADITGEFFNVLEEYPEGYTPPKTPILISALGERSYRAAGEIADAAISWMSPVPYLVNTSLPALRAGAESAGRETPPLIAHVPVALTNDRSRAIDLAAQDLGYYGALPFYRRVFVAAGVPPYTENRTSVEALDAVTVSGSPEEIRNRLAAILAEGIGEVLIHPLYVGDEVAERAELAKILAG